MRKCKIILAMSIVVALVIIATAVAIALMPVFGELISFSGLCLSIFLLVLMAACLEGVNNYGSTVDASKI